MKALLVIDFTGIDCIPLDKGVSKRQAESKFAHAFITALCTTLESKQEANEVGLIPIIIEDAILCDGVIRFRQRPLESDKDVLLQVCEPLVQFSHNMMNEIRLARDPKRMGLSSNGNKSKPDEK